MYDAPWTDAIPAAPLPPTGTPFELRRGEACARIGSVAAVLREFSVGGERYTETWPDDAAPPMAAGIVLVPWPNRVAGARWNWQGREQQLDITEVAHGNAIHGLARYTEYQVREQTDDAVTLGTVLYPQHGWPFTLDTEVTYALVDDRGGATGLRVTHRVTNRGAAAAVFGCGAHPYLRVGETPTDQLTLRLRARRQLETNEALIPVGSRPPEGPLAALPTGAPLKTLHLDTGFADLDQVNGRFEHVLEAPDGRTLTVWADPAFRYTVVFTPNDFPDDPSRSAREDHEGVVIPGTHRAVAIEPMTCPTNALNSGEGLIELAPGEGWQASWGLTPGS